MIAYPESLGFDMSYYFIQRGSVVEIIELGHPPSPCLQIKVLMRLLQSVIHQQSEF